MVTRAKMVKGFTAITCTNATQHIDYMLVERNGKRYAEPVGKARKSFDNWWPLIDEACCRCGVYGLVHTVRIGEYACANYGDKCILVPKHNKTGIEE